MPKSMKVGRVVRCKEAVICQICKETQSQAQNLKKHVECKHQDFLKIWTRLESVSYGNALKLTLDSHLMKNVHIPDHVLKKYRETKFGSKLNFKVISKASTTTIVMTPDVVTTDSANNAQNTASSGPVAVAAPATTAVVITTDRTDAQLSPLSTLILPVLLVLIQLMWWLLLPLML